MKGALELEMHNLVYITRHYELCNIINCVILNQMYALYILI